MSELVLIGFVKLDSLVNMTVPAGVYQYFKCGKSPQHRLICKSLTSGNCCLFFKKSI